MINRVEWISGIYQDMTGELPPESFWETPCGQEIVENNPAWLYDQPNANLYQIISELPPETRAEVLRRIRSRQSDAPPDDKKLLLKAICQSAFHFFAQNQSLFQECERYQKAAEPQLKAQYQKIVRKRGGERIRQRAAYRYDAFKNAYKTSLRVMEGHGYAD